jgi:hypothetical protein
MIFLFVALICPCPMIPATPPANDSDSNCSKECDCCDKCPVSKFLEKLSLAGFGSNLNNKVPLLAPNLYSSSSGTYQTYSGPSPQHYGERSDKNDKDTRITDPAYYTSIPGAIRGDVPVIYYPSCDPNAFYQPAIINYCADSSGWSKSS